MAQVLLPLFTSVNPDSLLTLASRNAGRALGLDSTLADAHVARAYALKGEWRWGESEREFRRALALAPEDATIHHWYGILLHATGRIEESLAQLELARQLDPLALQIQTDHYYVLYLARRFQDAMSEGERVWALDTTRSDGALQIGMIELALGHPDSALAAFQRAERLGSGFAMGAFQSVAARRLNQPRRADSLYLGLLEQYRRDPSLAYAVAVAAGAAGDLGRGIQAIEQTVRAHPIFATEFNLPCEPMLDPLRRDVRFARALEAAGMRVCRGP
jgi:tetratricopeptide (TPR) repeat protein